MVSPSLRDHQTTNHATNRTRLLCEQFSYLVKWFYEVKMNLNLRFSKYTKYEKLQFPEKPFENVGIL